MKDYNDFAADEDYRLAKLEEQAIKCEVCGEVIDDIYYEIEGVCMCYDCLVEEYGRSV